MAPRKPTKQMVHVYLDKALLRPLDKLARRYQLSRSELIRAALVYYLEKGIVPEGREG
jgi:metal-responsive CopG/Arc/MetJ family transcriptional regulator